MTPKRSLLSLLEASRPLARSQAPCARALRSPRSELLAIQRDAVARLTREIEGDLVRERPAIRRYHDAYSLEFAGSFATSSREELAEEAARSDLVYVGDYHTLEASQRTFLWLAETVHARRSRVALALEMFEPADQPAIDAYLAGTLDEESFLERIRYAQRWGFPWEHYRPILDFARRTRSAVHGFDRRPGLRRATLALRDRFAARVIAEIVAATPGTPVLVLAGDLHLARGHLPLRTASRLAALGLRKASLHVFQNAEPVYWKLARRKREMTEVVRLPGSGPARFNVMVATPLAKVRSYLDWARSAGDEPRLPAPGDSADDEERAAELLPLLADFFRVPAPVEAALAPDPPGDEVLDAIGTADALPARTELDRAAERATRTLRAALDGREARADACAVALEEAFAFLGSLVVNHARAHRTEADYRRFLARTARLRLSGDLAHARSVARVVLRQAEREARGLESRAGRPRLSLAGVAPLARVAAARALGQRLGARLYRALLDGRVSKERLRELFLDSGNAREAYFELVAALRERARARPLATARRTA